MLSTDDIWAELRRRRITAKDIAEVLGVARTTVSRTINGDIRSPNPRILACIARAIGKEPFQLCPGRRVPRQGISPIEGASISESRGSRTSISTEEAA